MVKRMRETIAIEKKLRQLIAQTLQVAYLYIDIGLITKKVYKF